MTNFVHLKQIMKVVSTVMKHSKDRTNWGKVSYESFTGICVKQINSFHQNMLQLMWEENNFLSITLFSVANTTLEEQMSFRSSVRPSVRPSDHLSPKPPNSLKSFISPYHYLQHHSHHHTQHLTHHLTQHHNTT